MLYNVNGLNADKTGYNTSLGYISVCNVPKRFNVNFICKKLRDAKIIPDSWYPEEDLSMQAQATFYKWNSYILYLGKRTRMNKVTLLVLNPVLSEEAMQNIHFTNLSFTSSAVTATSTISTNFVLPTVRIV